MINCFYLIVFLNCRVYKATVFLQKNNKDSSPKKNLLTIKKYVNLHLLKNRYDMNIMIDGYFKHIFFDIILFTCC